MSDDNTTNGAVPEFDFSSFPANTLFHERRTGKDRREAREDGPKAGLPGPKAAPPERRARKERRKRIDPTTFEKQYSDDELEFMNAMQRYKERTGKAFPTYGEVIKVAVGLGYRRKLHEEHPTSVSGDGPGHGVVLPLHPDHG